MMRRVTCQIWCETCCCDDAERLHRLVFSGRTTTRGGRLKVDAACSVCRRLLAAGGYAEAVTFHELGKRFTSWEREYLTTASGERQCEPEGVA